MPEKNLSNIIYSLLFKSFQMIVKNLNLIYFGFGGVYYRLYIYFKIQTKNYFILYF